LTESIEDHRGELAEFVEEQDAAVGWDLAMLREPPVPDLP
jgi:hypothetical protein